MKIKFVLPTMLKIMKHPDYKLYGVHDRIAIKNRLRSIDQAFCSYVQPLIENDEVLKKAYE